MRIDGREIAAKINEDLKKRVGELQERKVTAHLVVMLVGDNPASVSYVSSKEKKGTEVGIKVTVLRYPKSATTSELRDVIENLNTDPFVHGIIVQHPLPEHIDADLLETKTAKEKDVDGFRGDSLYDSPLALAVYKILSYVGRHEKVENIDDWLRKKTIAVKGKGKTGGKPVIDFLKKKEVHVSVIDSKTSNPQSLIQAANIVITTVGKKDVIQSSFLKKGVILVGVGMYKGSDGKIHGDYEEEDIKNISSYYTPYPGGVGPINVAMLLLNVLLSAERT